MDLGVELDQIADSSADAEGPEESPAEPAEPAEPIAEVAEAPEPSPSVAAPSDADRTLANEERETIPVPAIADGDDEAPHAEEQVLPAAIVPPRPTPKLATAELMGRLDQMNDQFDHERGERLAIQSMQVAFGSLSVGAVAWTIRSFSVLAAILSVSSTWQTLDPLVLLKGVRKSKRRRNRAAAGSDRDLRSLAASLEQLDLPEYPRDQEVPS